MPEIGKLLVILGLATAAIGALLLTGFGKLPGDINLTKGNIRFHFPIVTCILISILLTILLRLFRK